MQRQMDLIDKQLEMGHRQKVDNFNKQLANEPEHFDIPKVGPG